MKFRLTLFLLLSFTGATIAFSQESPPVGIAFENISYPYPVHFLRLQLENQNVLMAYMDVVPKTNPNGRTAVLLHGKNFYGAYWQNTIRVLTDAGYRVVVPDQIGFGKSSKPDIAYSFTMLAANTATLLDSLDIKRAVVIGHSMGGMLAVRFARDYPDRTDALVLEDPLGLEDYRNYLPEKTLDQLLELETKVTTTTYHETVKRYFVTWNKDYERFTVARFGVMQSGEYPRFVRSAARTTQMILDQPVRKEFSQLRPDTLLIIGDRDRTAIGKEWVRPSVAKKMGNYPALAKRVVKEIPNGKLVVIKAIGHIPHIEAPSRFHKALLDFLN